MYFKRKDVVCFENKTKGWVITIPCPLEGCHLILGRWLWVNYSGRKPYDIGDEIEITRKN